MVQCIGSSGGVGWHFKGEGLTVLWIGFVQWSSGAGDGNPNAVPAIEDLADPADVEANGDDFTGLQEDFCVESFAIAESPRVIDDQHGSSIGVDITDSNNDVGIGRC